MIAERTEPQIKVSVIIPVYNLEKYITGCVNSILKQDFRDFEIILVNDGSTDTSGSICEKIVSENKDVYIRVIHQMNYGVSAARNTGLEAAKGKYVVFVDGDDAITRDYLGKLTQLIEYNDADIVMCTYRDAYSIEERDNLSCSRITDSYSTPSYTSSEVLQLLLQQKISPSSCEKIIKRSSIGDIRFWVGKKYNEDKYFQFQILLNTSKVIITDLKMYICLNRKESASRLSTNFNLDLIEIAEMIIYDIKKSKYSEHLEVWAHYNFILTALYNTKLLVRKNIATKDRNNLYKIIKQKMYENTTKNLPKLGLKYRIELYLFNAGLSVYSVAVYIADMLKRKRKQ